MHVRTLVDDFARQLYLPRLARPSILADALRSGVAYLTWRARGDAADPSWTSALL